MSCRAVLHLMMLGTEPLGARLARVRPLPRVYPLMPDLQKNQHFTDVCIIKMRCLCVCE